MKNRRTFLKTATATGLAAPFVLPSKVWADPASGRLAHAAIGCSNQALSDLRAIVSSGKVDVVALCDVDTAVAEEARKLCPNARFFQDWRSLFGEMKDKIDSVNIAVPDHMHAAIAATALRKGKHTYCQKPLTHTIGEARALARLAGESGKVTQMGNQIQSSLEYRRAVTLLQQGIIGKIKEVHCWISATFPQRGRPQGEDVTPATLNWDMWLGVAPQRPYRKDIYHRFNWRGWQDFGGGPVADFICHIMDTPKKALELDLPLSVEAVSLPDDWVKKPEWNKENWPDWAIYRWEFAGTKYTAGNITGTWYDGGKQPDPKLFEGATIPPGGALFIGEKGKLLLPHIGNPSLIPYAKIEYPKLEARDHYHHFVQCALSGGKEQTTSPFSYGAALTETGLLCNIAARFPGKRLEWDKDAVRFKNEEAANAFVQPHFRGGWNVEGVG